MSRSCFVNYPVIYRTSRMVPHDRATVEVILVYTGLVRIVEKRNVNDAMFQIVSRRLPLFKRIVS